MMKLMLIPATILALAATPALADKAATPEEVTKIEAALKDMGCNGYDEIEKENEGHFEIDDAQCADGQYDIKLDKDFKLMRKDKE